MKALIKASKEVTMGRFEVVVSADEHSLYVTIPGMPGEYELHLVPGRGDPTMQFVAWADDGEILRMQDVDVASLADVRGEHMNELH